MKTKNNDAATVQLRREYISGFEDHERAIEVADAIFKNSIRVVGEFKEKATKIASNKKDPVRAYWSILRLEAQAYKKANSSNFKLLEKSNVMPHSELRHLLFSSMEYKASMLNDRLYLMHEVDFQARFNAIKSISDSARKMNEKLLETVSGHAHESGYAQAIASEYEYRELIKGIDSIKGDLISRIRR
ncbi:MAG: hypothetical protein M1544_02705 [Candidatus Marsarchaeota archaeon]|nr:hypothetical protein [Candidatus Marsarchaeota archaeon]MCL5102240.1 hypothetical protein [Candidatus Marsarchaeota archaeon]